MEETSWCGHFAIEKRKKGRTTHASDQNQSKHRKLPSLRVEANRGSTFTTKEVKLEYGSSNQERLKISEQARTGGVDKGEKKRGLRIQRYNDRKENSLG